MIGKETRVGGRLLAEGTGRRPEIERWFAVAEKAAGQER